MRQEHQSIASWHPKQGSNLQPRCVLAGDWTYDPLVYRMPLPPTDPPGQGQCKRPFSITGGKTAPVRRRCLTWSPGSCAVGHLCSACWGALGVMSARQRVPFASLQLCPTSFFLVWGTWILREWTGKSRGVRIHFNKSNRNPFHSHCLGISLFYNSSHADEAWSCP